MSEDRKIRLSKLMSEQGLSSRREADELIQKGWVKVNGVTVDQLGIKVDPDVKIELTREAKDEQQERVTIILNKPIGYLSGPAEDGYPSAVSLIKNESRYKGESKSLMKHHFGSLAVSGRLDIDSKGLLVLTQDGRIAKQLIGEDKMVDKEYLVRVEGELSPRDLRLLNFGMELDGEKLKPALVEWLNKDQLRFVLKQGKKRQIRRMCDIVGLKVLGLKRVRIGKVKLGDLPEGQWRFLRNGEQF